MRKEPHTLETHNTTSDEVVRTKSVRKVQKIDFNMGQNNNTITTTTHEDEMPY